MEAPTGVRWWGLPGSATPGSTRWGSAFPGLPALVVLGLLALALACRGPEPTSPRPLLVIGIDGASWRVLDPLFEQGALPHLASLAEAGVSSILETDYGASPVIWTTIATGQKPRVHGITDFVVPTPRGDVPVSSALRRVPALWNMASVAGKRVLVAGWWASWPAEAIDGTVISDRVLLPVEERVHPPELLPWIDALAAESREHRELFPGDDLASHRDELTTRAARELLAGSGPGVGEGTPHSGASYDLALVYFRAVDIVSHNRWKYFEPAGFPDLDPAELAAHRDDVPAIYRATDAAIGALLAAAGPETNVLVISDHGFKAAAREEIQLLFDLDAVLARLGYLTPRAGRPAGARGVDLARSRLFTWRTPLHRPVKRVRFALAGRDLGGTVRPRDRPSIRGALERDLARVRWPDGQPVLTLREAPDWQEELGADLIVEVLLDGVAGEVEIDGEPFAEAVQGLSRISGTHTKGTHGILIAAGPDIDPGADPRGIDIHDIAPTVLYGLGLPVAEDFAGEAWTALYTEAFRRAHPLRTLPTWGKPGAGRTRASGADDEVLRELRALGYLE